MCSKLLFCLLSLTLFITISASQDDSYESYSFCSPSKCGTIDDIIYPFGIKGRDENCSYPGFILDCNGDTPEINIGSKIYHVKDIDYGTQTLTIVDPDIIGKNCPPPLRNSTLNNFSIFDFALDTVNLTLYYNCTHPITNAGFPLQTFPCLTSSNKYSYYMIHPVPLPSLYRGDCQVSFFPIPDSAVSRLGENLTNFEDVMKDGFNVSWLVDSGNCYHCVVSGGNCGYNQNKPDQPLCYCSGKAYPEAYTCPPPSTTTPLPPTPSCQVSFFPIPDSVESRLGENLTSFEDVMKDGFDVSWVKVDSGNCHGCVVSGGNCGYNQNKPDQPLCYCSGKAYPEAYTCPPPTPSGRKPNIRKKIIIGIGAAVAGLFLASFVYVVITRKIVKREYNTYDHNNMDVLFCWRQPINNVEAFLRSCGSLAPRRFRYSDLKKMTNSFKDKLGQGGYGGVFKGQLKDGRLVAVKVLNKSKGNGEEFINQVAGISRTNHVNVVTLLSFCYERSKRALIYEFMSNGSLEKFIYSDKSVNGRVLECETSFKIAVGIARGLEYLHRWCTTRILHFDIKPHNILLDDNFCPKISYFGLAKLCPEYESVVSMHDARGTMGYIAPEVHCRNIGVASYKSDVYSYGMMVLEMVAGRKNLDAGVSNPSEIYFPHWIYNRVDLQESLELHGIDNDADKEIARKLALVGLWCIQTDPTNRPSMSKVVEMLEGSLENLHLPPKP